MGRRGGVRDGWWERKERSRREDLALNIPSLVCQQLVFVIPLQRWGWFGSELAVERGLLVLQHHLALRSHHRPRKTLICERGRQTSALLRVQTSNHQVPSACMSVHRPAQGFLLKAANSSVRLVSKWPSGGGVCQHLRGASRGDLMRSVNRPCSLSAPSSPLFYTGDHLLFLCNYLN